MEPIVAEAEKALNSGLDICEEFPSNFYRPFTTLSLAVFLGNKVQNEKAKKYVAQLGDIIMEKNGVMKSKLIIEYLERVEDDQSFDNFRKIQDKFGFQYAF